MAYRKYMFDLDFDPPHTERKDESEADEAYADEPPPPPPPTFTEDELNIAREAAYDEGRLAGIAAARETIDQQIASALGAMIAQSDRLFRLQDEANETSVRNAVRVAQAVLKKVLPGACRQYAFEEVTHAVEEVVGHILDEPRIIVRVAAGLVEPVRERLDAAVQAHGFEGRVLVQEDARLTVGDCRVEWADGGAERDQARLLADVDEIIDRALARPEQKPHDEDGGDDAG